MRGKGLTYLPPGRFKEAIIYLNKYRFVFSDFN